MMKKQLIILLLCLPSLGMWAQNAIAVHQQDGNVVKFAFEEKPVVTYVGDFLVLTTTKTMVEYPIFLLKKISFDVEDVAEERVQRPVQYRSEGSRLLRYRLAGVV